MRPILTGRNQSEAPSAPPSSAGKGRDGGGRNSLLAAHAPPRQMAELSYFFEGFEEKEE